MTDLVKRVDCPDAFRKLLHRWKSADPEEISQRTGIDYDPGEMEFSVHLMNVDYKVRYPDFRVRCPETLVSYRPLEEFWSFKTYVLKFLLEGSNKRSREKRFNNIVWGTIPTGIYSINNGRPDDICLTTVDYALTYMLVASELEKTGIPCNLIITESGGISVCTAWVLGKYDAGTISDFFVREEIGKKIRSRELLIPGRIGFMAEELEKKLPGWKVIPATKEAKDLGTFLKDYMAREHGKI